MASTLQVRNTLDFTGIKERALADARRMQATVDDECSRSGKPRPEYELSELIGKGSFGRVYKATSTRTRQLVAIKVIDIEQSDSESLNAAQADTYSDLLKEINALQLLAASGARNINLVIEALPVGQTMWMITEYCAGGSVATLMKPTHPGGLQEKWIVPILREVAEAMFWVHGQGIIHRDIKCANILVTEAGSVQLCDFGVSGIIETKLDKRSTVIGTPHWMAPELLLADSRDRTSYGTEVDIWAFGAMTYEIASGFPPNVKFGMDFHRLCNFLRQNAPRLEGDEFSPGLKSLVECCLQSDPTWRPTIEQVQQHAYIAGTEQQYPTSSLAMLVRAYKMWEAQGGSRRSLFFAGGAQGPANPMPDSSPLGGDDDWNFSTTAAFDQSLLGHADAQAVYDVYGSNVDFAGSDHVDALTARPRQQHQQQQQQPQPPPQPPQQQQNPQQPLPQQPQPQPQQEQQTVRGKASRRRPPPQLPKLKAPLEKVFDPNTMSSYADNARLYYGKPAPPPPQQPRPQPQPQSHPQPPRLRSSSSDLPLRDDSSQANQVRESLIDLDASFGGGTARLIDMETIKGPRASRSYGGPVDFDDYEFSNPPTSDPYEDMRNDGSNSNRRTQDWKFPSAAVDPPTSDSSGSDLPASAGPQAFRFPFTNPQESSGSNEPTVRPGIVHHPTEPLTSRRYDDLSPHHRMPRSSSFAAPNRESVSSLIDLDMSLDVTRPTTSQSQSRSGNDSHNGSIGGSVHGSATSGPGSAVGHFEPEHLPTAPYGSRPREPSVYIDLDEAYVPSFGGTAREPSIYADSGPWARESSIHVETDKNSYASSREPSIYAESGPESYSANREPSIYIEANQDAFTSNREPSIYVEANNEAFAPNRREPSIYVEASSDAFASNREPSIYVDLGNETFPSNREPSLYAESGDDALASNREPSIYVESGREPSLYAESIHGGHPSAREPSIYVSDNTDIASHFANLSISQPPANDAPARPDSRARYSGGTDLSESDFSASHPPSMHSSGRASAQKRQRRRNKAPMPHHTHHRGHGGGGQHAPRRMSGISGTSDSRAISGFSSLGSLAPLPDYPPLPDLPPLPAPPTLAVMEGRASASEVRDELRRMAQSLKEHLGVVSARLEDMPVSKPVDGKDLGGRV